MELDLSWSGIVDKVLHEKKEGANLIAKIADEKEVIDKAVSVLEKELLRLNTQRLRLIQGALMVAKHLELKPPLIISRTDYIIKLSSEGITIDRNVI